MNQNFVNISAQDAVWYSARLDAAFQARTRIIPQVEVVNIGNNKTYTGQVQQRLVSNAVGEDERPVFQTPALTTYTATVTAYECPCFVSDVSLANVQFGRDVLGRVGESIGNEMGRRADQVFINGISAGYDTDNTISASGYLNVEVISQAYNALGAKAVGGDIVCLIDYDQYNNLLLDERFSNWMYNPSRPLSENNGEPANDYLMRYQGILFVKLANDTPLPLTTAGKRRLFMFSKKSCEFLSGTVEPYGTNSPIVQFQVHRGGYDINNRRRMGFVVTQPEGILAIEVTDGIKQTV